MSLDRMFDVTGKSVIVTGAAYGLGRAYAEIMASRGGDVTLLDINGDQLDRTVDEIRDSGIAGQVAGVQLDVALNSVLGEQR